LSQRLSVDSALTLPQTTVGVLATVGAYANTSPARGAVKSLLVLTGPWLGTEAAIDRADRAMCTVSDEHVPLEHPHAAARLRRHDDVGRPA